MEMGVVGEPVVLHPLNGTDGLSDSNGHRYFISTAMRNVGQICIRSDVQDLRKRGITVELSGIAQLLLMVPLLTLSNSKFTITMSLLVTTKK